MKITNNQNNNQNNSLIKRRKIIKKFFMTKELMITVRENGDIDMSLLTMEQEPCFLIQFKYSDIKKLYQEAFKVKYKNG